MYYSPAMDEIKDFTDLAAAFTGDIRHGFISRVEGSGMEKSKFNTKAYYHILSIKYPFKKKLINLLHNIHLVNLPQIMYYLLNLNIVVFVDNSFDLHNMIAYHFFLLFLLTDEVLKVQIY